VQKHEGVRGGAEWQEIFEAQPGLTEVPVDGIAAATYDVTIA
jgi:hypothetical protein